MSARGLLVWLLAGLLAGVIAGWDLGIPACCARFAGCSVNADIRRWIAPGIAWRCTGLARAGISMGIGLGNAGHAMRRCTFTGSGISGHSNVNRLAGTAFQRISAIFRDSPRARAFAACSRLSATRLWFFGALGTFDVLAAPLRRSVSRPWSAKSHLCSGLW